MCSFFLWLEFPKCEFNWVLHVRYRTEKKVSSVIFTSRIADRSLAIRYCCIETGEKTRKYLPTNVSKPSAYCCFFPDRNLNRCCVAHATRRATTATTTTTFKSKTKMDCAPNVNIFRELQVVHDTGYFSSQISPEEDWQQVNSNDLYLKTQKYLRKQMYSYLLHKQSMSIGNIWGEKFLFDSKQVWQLLIRAM